MARVFRVSVISLGCFFSLLTLTSFLKGFYWLFDVFTHFHFHYTVGLGLCILLLIFLRPRWSYLGLFLVALGLNVYLLWPYFWPRPSLLANTLSVATLNVYTDNSDYQKIIDYLQGANLDVVFLSEIEPPLMEKLQQDLKGQYPHAWDESMEGTHGLAFISKQPLQGETIALDERQHRFIKVGLEFQGQKIAIYAAHPHPPLSPFWSKSRDDEIAVIQEHIQQESNPHIFLGDFNASPWSKPLQELFKETTLFHGAKGFGIYPTWRYKTILLSAPLDHILLSSEWQVTEYRLDSDIGSDHFPVVAKVFLR
jgi:endonuclease/exonuclease/phosphatase (EEP) superfamily protein YafD